MRKTTFRNLLIGTAFGTASLGLFCSAQAQTAPTTTTTKDSNGLEVVTVTVRKRSENLQKIPASVFSISKKTLSESHVQDLHDIQYLTPGINVTDFGSETGTSVTIRGVTDLTFGVNVPDVAFFFDGVYLREPAAISIAAIPMHNIDVQTNPSSALYGRDAYTGVIAYIPERPTSTPHANLEYTVGDYGKEQVVGNVSGPIYGDKVTGELFGMYDNFDGTYKDSVSGVKAGGDLKKDFGGLLDFKWSEHFSTHIDGYYGYDYFNQDPISTLTPNCGTSTNTSGPGDALYCGKIVNNGKVEVGSDPQAGSPGNERRTFLGGLRNTISYDWGTIDSITGATKINEQAFGIFDASSTGRPYLLANLVPGTTAFNPVNWAAPPNGQSVLEHETYGAASDTSNFSEELRYSSPIDQRLRYGFGGYYYRERRIVLSCAGLETQGIPAGEELWSYFGAYGVPLSTWETSYGQCGPDVNIAHQLSTESSGFANGSFDILPNLTIETQYRYTDSLQQFVAVRNQYDGPSVLDPLGPHISQTNQYFNSTDDIRWLPIPNVTLYFMFANGTKPGGFNGASTVKADEAFGPETDTSFEGGAKTTWYDNHLQVNVAAYHVDTQNTQAYGPSSDPLNAATVIKNFGASSNTGFDLNMTGKLDATTLTFGLSYNNPTFSAGSYDLADYYCADIAACAPHLVNVNGSVNKGLPIQGFAVPYSPKITLSVTAKYDFEFMDVYKGFVRANLSYKTSEDTTAGGSYFPIIGPSTNVDFYTGVSRGPYSLGAYVKNVTDNRVPVNFQNEVQLEYFQPVPVVNLPPGRTFAFTFGVHF